MLTRTRPSSQQYRSRQQPNSIVSTPPPNRSKSRPHTPVHSRSDRAPGSSSSTPLCQQLPPHSMPEQPGTHTSKKPDRRTRGGAPSSTQRILPTDLGHQSPGFEAPEDSEGSLFDLLGVISPRPAQNNHNPRPTPGILPVSKSDLDSTQGRGATRRRGHQVADSEPEIGSLRSREAFLQTETEPGSSSLKIRTGRRKQRAPSAHGDRERGVISEGEIQANQPGRQTRRTGRQMEGQLSKVDLPARTGAVPSKPSGISATRPKTRRPPQPIAESSPSIEVDGTFEISALSRSLPSGSFLAPAPLPYVKARIGKKGHVSEDESAVWEMPDPVGPTVGGELTVSWASIRINPKLSLRSGSRNSRTTPPTPSSAPPSLSPNAKFTLARISNRP